MITGLNRGFHVNSPLVHLVGSLCCLVFFALMLGCGSGGIAAGTDSSATAALAFTPIASHTYGDPPFAVSAKSVSLGAVSYSIAGPAIISGNVVTLTGAGTVRLWANEEADGNYTAQTASTSFTVNPATPVLTFTNIASHTYGDAPFQVSAWSVSTGAILYSVLSGPATIAGNVVTLTGTGTVILRATQAATSNYSAQTASISFTVNPSTSIVANPAPVVTLVSPSMLTAITTVVTLTGSGFTPTSTVTLNSHLIQSSYIDSSHLSATVVLPAPANNSFTLVVVNPAPSVTTSNPITVSSQFSNITVSPQQLSGGSVTLTLSGSNFAAGDVVYLAGKPTITTINSSTSITATGFLAPWLTGLVEVELRSGDGTEPISSQSVPIAPTAVSFDAAARFSTQAAYGPRPDVVLHIQQIGFDAFITEQMNEPIIDFSPNQARLTLYLHALEQGNSLLRPRIAWALQNFIVPSAIFIDTSAQYIESTFERDATGNFRTLMTDIASDPNIGTFLNLVGNDLPTDPSIHPNQNFARELMQLFTLGPNLLNDDGSLKLDSAGQPIPTYDQNTVIDLTRALTGWNLPIPVNPQSTLFGIDYSQPLSASDSQHDHTAKVLFGSVYLPAGQTIEQDRDAALDAIFNHPNLPPYVSRLLIQHLVKSGPSAAYVARISHVFEDDGTGVRGNLAAVVRAILLDPEARHGDTTPSPDDGFIQDPVLFETFALSALQIQGGDGQPDYLPSDLGEPFWYAPTVFGFYDPAFVIPGTSINAPEFSLFNNMTLQNRSEALWGIINNTQPGFGTYLGTSWLFANFTTVPDMVDALNHLLYHGTMSTNQQQIILNYCSQLNPFLTTAQLQSAVFLAMNADSYNVSH
jgi:Protein of unknown function (DUF1800)